MPQYMYSQGNVSTFRVCIIENDLNQLERSCKHQQPVCEVADRMLAHYISVLFLNVCLPLVSFVFFLNS